MPPEWTSRWFCKDQRKGVHPSTPNRYIDASTLDGTGYSGVPAGCGENSLTVTNSIVKNYQRPIGGYYCAVTLTNNQISNMPNGVLGNVADGFVKDGTVYTFVSRNTFVNNGIVLRSGAMDVRDNVFTRNTTGAVFLEPQWSTAIGNTFTSNSSSGIKTDLPGLTVGSNTSTYNGRYGIYAPSAVNLGGNVAYGNKLGQCVGLTCAGP